METIITSKGYKIEPMKVEEFGTLKTREGCVQITRPGNDKPSMFIVLADLLEEYMDWTDECDGDVQRAIDYAKENGFEE